MSNVASGLESTRPDSTRLDSIRFGSGLGSCQSCFGYPVSRGKMKRNAVASLSRSKQKGFANASLLLRPGTKYEVLHT
jgi:hypothetical protein